MCKGIWLSKKALLTVFNSHEEIQKLTTQELEGLKPISFACPDCKSPLSNGKALDSEVIIDCCTTCEKYFFDDKELKQLLEHIQGASLPKAKEIDWSKEQVIKSDENCPLCQDKPLFGLKGRMKTFSVCLECNGVATNVDALQKLANKSLFGPTMFEFRRTGEIVSYCRYCGLAQEKRNEDCIKCARAIQRLKCYECKSQFSEYEHDDVVIDRCQMCNAVWLDSGEFEKVMTIMPDVKKQIERLYLDDRLREIRMDAISESYGISIERDRRIMINKFWGPLLGPLLFY